MAQDTAIYLTKAIESLLTAESEFVNGGYNSGANRCYYACFQAAIAALLSEGIRPAGQWNHPFVQAQFVGVLLNQRKRYDTQLRRILADNQSLRDKADYRPELVTATRLRGRLDAHACSSPPFEREEVLPNEPGKPNPPHPAHAGSRRRAEATDHHAFSAGRHGGRGRV